MLSKAACAEKDVNAADAIRTITAGYFLTLYFIINHSCLIVYGLIHLMLSQFENFFPAIKHVHFQ